MEATSLHLRESCCQLDPSCVSLAIRSAAHHGLCESLCRNSCAEGVGRGTNVEGTRKNHLTKINLTIHKNGAK